MAGVGSTPADSGTAPSAAMPAARCASSPGPLSRVSRPSSTRGDSIPSARTMARPIFWTVASSSGGSPARPRIPSVPKNRILILNAAREARLSFASAVARVHRNSALAGVNPARAERRRDPRTLPGQL